MEYLTCEQAAEIARCSIFHIREAIKSGLLKAYRPAKGYLIAREDLDEWVKKAVVKA